MKRQINIRRHGQLVGIYTNKEKAFGESLPGDQVFEVVGTYGEHGCINEHQIYDNNEGRGTK